MSKHFEFIRDCGVFFVLSINGDYPAGRPFGGITEIDGDLYIPTSDTKAVYRQIKADPHVQLVALKDGGREWLRLTGIATEYEGIEIKERMFAECPPLINHYSSAADPHFAVFKIKVSQVEFN